MKLKLKLLLLLTALPLGALQAAVDVLLAASSDEQLKPVLAALGDVKAAPHASWQFWTGTLDGHSVAVTRTEGDPLNAVSATTLAIRLFEPKLVVTFGVARPHDPALKSGDVVVSERFAPFDGIFSEHSEIGEGSDINRWHKLPHPLISTGEVENDTDIIVASPVALKVASAVKPSTGKLVTGTLGSAYQWNAEADRIAWLHATWGTSCEDMESAHVAACAALFKIPAVGIRVIQTLDTPAGSAAPYRQYGMPDSPAYVAEAARLTIEFLRNLP